MTETKMQNYKKASYGGMALNLPIYITLSMGGIVCILQAQPGWQRWTVAAIILALAVIFALPLNECRPVHLWLHLISTTGLMTSLLLFGIEPGIPLVLFFIIAAQSMMIFQDWRGFAWVGLLSVINATAFITKEGFLNGIINMLVYGGGYIFFGVFGRALSQATDARRESQRLLAELQQAHEQLQDYVIQMEELAVTRERNRMAREMHDSIGHRLTVAAVQLEGAQRLIPQDPAKAETMLTTVRGQVKDALAELRSTVAALREPIEADLSLRQALERLTTSFSELTGIHVQLELQDLPPLEETLRKAVFRSVQEALTNAQRYARAKNILVQLGLEEGNNTLALTISDDGVGFSGVPNETRLGFGLRGMQERAQLLGGTCAFSNQPAGGARIDLRLPYMAAPKLLSTEQEIENA